MNDGNQTSGPQRFQGLAQGAGPDIKEQAEKKAEENAQRRAVQIHTNANGLLVSKTFDEEWRMASMLCASGMLPRGYDDAAKVMAARQFAIELGLKPLTALRQIAVIHGTPSLFGDLPLALVRSAKVLSAFDEWLFDKQLTKISLANQNIGTEVYGAACTSTRDGRTVESYFTMDDARKAGLFPASNPDKPWARYTKRMLQMRARSINLKDQCPDILSGVAIAEYDFGETSESLVGPEKARVVSGTTEDLNKEFAQELGEKINAVMEAIDAVKTPENDPEQPAFNESCDPEVAKHEPIAEAAEPVAEPEQAENVVGIRSGGHPEAPAYMFAAGLFAGQPINEVDAKDLQAYYRKLRAKKAASGLLPDLIEVMDQIEKHLEGKRG